MADKVLMLGNEAIARGAYEAGVKVSSAYPGTPSTEISEFLVQYKDDIYEEWAPNEKVAAEVAVGASIAGVRSMACMKHYGLITAMFCAQCGFTKRIYHFLNNFRRHSSDLMGSFSFSITLVKGIDPVTGAIVNPVVLMEMHSRMIKL